MRILLIMILFCFSKSLLGQKPVIDSIVYKNWPSLEGPTISENGRFVFYNINNVPVGNKTLVVQSTNGKWKIEIKGGLSDGYTSFRGQYLWFLKNDSLGMLSLGTGSIKYVSKVSSFWFQKAGEDEYLIYRSENNLVVKNLKTHKERFFMDVNSWNFNEDMLVLIKSINDKERKQSINLANIVTGKVSKIWEGNNPENLILDAKHQQLAFKTGDSLWYFKSGLATICISDKNFFNIEPGLSLGYLDSFSKDGKTLFSSLVGKRDIRPRKGVVEIWSYTDVKLQTEQEKVAIDQKYLAGINLVDHKVIRLQQQEGESHQFPLSDGVNGNLVLVQNPIVGDRWISIRKLTWSLVSTESGQTKTLDFLDNINVVNISPNGNYLVYFNNLKQDYFSYEIATGIIRNLTNGLEILWKGMDRDDLSEDKSEARGLVAWVKNDEFVLVYDRFDIWKLDPLNKEKPINLTNGYGRKNQIVFSYTFQSYLGNILNRDQKLHLTAFNNEDKNNGFFYKQLDNVGDPTLLSMGGYLYQSNSPYVPFGSDFQPVKAKKAEMYIVRRMSATDAPNYFSTKDFKTFTKLSDLQPHKSFNWYTTELHSWKSLDGRTLKGILYKPENFDPSKKYPVIFHYYERKSDGLNAYIKPEILCNGCNIDIPTYVSNEYLVFTLDIYYKVGDPMQGTYNSVVSAANYISKLRFVNPKKMGIQGCSFGGIQTNYLVTHTNLFAAAESSSGLADLVSSYGRLDGGSGNSNQEMFEGGQPRMGRSIWESPGAYIKNAAIFQLDKVSTPFLIMHTKKDTRCPFEDAIELFTGLRRLGKKSWMLVYSEGSHGVWGKEANDFSIRMMQFFDHYLKDKPAPIWMLDGVTKDRSWKADLELDVNGRSPGPGLLTPEEQQKVDSMMTRKPITITLK